MTEFADKREKEIADATSALIDGASIGLDMAISMMRAGHLRLAPHPFEVGRHPYNHRFKLWRALWCVWKEWRREHLHYGIMASTKLPPEIDWQKLGQGVSVEYLPSGHDAGCTCQWCERNRDLEAIQNGFG